MRYAYPPDKPKKAFTLDALHETTSPLDSLIACFKSAQEDICAPADCPIIYILHKKDQSQYNVNEYQKRLIYLI